MAETSVVPYSIDSNFKFEHHQFLLNKQVTYTQLQAKLTEDYIHDVALSFREKLKEYGIFFKGPLNKAYGEGIRHIYIHGGYETHAFTPPTPGTNQQIYVPYHRDDKFEIYNNIFRLVSYTKDADILAASDVFLNVADLGRFRRSKKGDVAEGCFMNIGLFMTAGLGQNHFERYESLGGLGTLLIGKADDTTENGKKAKGAKEELAKVKDKENNIKNVYQGSCFEGLNQTNTKEKKRYKTESLKNQSKEKAAKLFKTNEDITSAQTADCIVRMILYIYNRMQTPNFRNMPEYTGNDQENKKQFDANDIAMYMSAKPEDIVLIMSNTLYNFLSGGAATKILFTTPEGGYSTRIEDILKMKIVRVDILPINLIKIGSAARYNIHLLYGKTLVDTLGQQLLTTQSAHTAYLYGTREKVPFAEILINDGNFDPAYHDEYSPPAAEDLN